MSRTYQVRRVHKTINYYGLRPLGLSTVLVDGAGESLIFVKNKIYA